MVVVNSQVVSLPTSNNTLVVQFKNLSHNLNTVTLTAHDKSINTATFEAPSNVVADSSRTKKTSANSNTANGKSIINRDKVSKLGTLTFANQKELEVNESEAKIATQQKIVAQSDDSDTQTSINNARDDITQIRTQISDAQKNIQRAKTNISQYQKTKEQIQDGKSLLPKPTDL